MRRKNNKISLFAAVLTLAATAMVLFFEGTRRDRVLLLRHEIAENAAVAQRAQIRVKSLSDALGVLSEDIAAIEKLPLAPASTADELRAAIEQCAMTSGVSCSLAVTPAEQRAEFELNLRGAESNMIKFFLTLTARREFFLVERVDWRRSGDDVLDVRVGLTAQFGEDSDQ